MAWKPCPIRHWWRRTDRPGSGCGYGQSSSIAKLASAPTKPVITALRLPKGGGLGPQVANGQNLGLHPLSSWSASVGGTEGWGGILLHFCGSSDPFCKEVQ